MTLNTILVGDCRDTLRTLPEKSVHCVVTSPPYFGLRNYGGQQRQIGREATPDEFVAAMVAVFREVHRVLRDDGTFWLNLGDSYARNGGSDRQPAKPGQPTRRCADRDQRVPGGFKAKDRLMIPARTAIALHADGWYLRDEIVWHKPRTTPAPVTDRTVAAHEMLYCFSKSQRYYYDFLAIEEPATYAGVKVRAGKVAREMADADPDAARKRPTADREITVRETRRKRSVWSVSPSPFKGAHFATFPPDLIRPCILAGCPEGGIVLDPFFGAGTAGLVAQQNGRNWIGCELNPDYVPMAYERLGITSPVVKSCSAFDDLLGHNGGPAFEDILG